MNNKIVLSVIFTTLAFAFSSYSMQLPGGNTNKVRTMQPDGKILVFSQGDQPYSWEVSRFNRDNTLDATFGSGGTSGIMGSFNISFIPLSIETQPDGSILLKYIKQNDEGVKQLMQTRLNSTGTIVPFANGRIEEPIIMEKIR